MSLKKCLKLGFSLQLTLFIFVALAGVYFSFTVDQSGHMTDCLFVVGETVLCPMTVASHITAWREIITPIFSTVISLLVLVVVARLLRLFFQMRLPARGGGQWQYLSRDITPRWLQYLVRFFSDGIIQPRLFA